MTGKNDNDATAGLDKLFVEQWPISRVRPYDRNPRRNDAAVRAVADSIRRFGFRQPIVVDGDGVIVVGHTRWKAATKLGLEKVPVHVARELTPEQAKAYRIADNKTNELAHWDYARLADECQSLSLSCDDWRGLGFSLRDLEIIGMQPKPEKTPESKKARVKSGDVWRLGRHLLGCGDSLDGNMTEMLLRIAGVDLVPLCVTDPPFELSANQQMQAIEAFGADNAIVVGGGIEIYRVATTPGWTLTMDWLYVRMDRGPRSSVANTAHRLLTILLVDRNQAQSGIMMRRGKGRFNVDAWKAAAGTAANVVMVQNQRSERDYRKPAELYELFLAAFVNDGVVCDPFLRTGGVLIAAETAGKAAMGIELNPKRCDECLTRWEEMTGKVAEKIDEEETKANPRTVGKPGKAKAVRKGRPALHHGKAAPDATAVSARMPKG